MNGKVVFDTQEVDKYYESLCTSEWFSCFPNKEKPEDYKNRVNIRYTDAMVMYAMDQLGSKIHELKEALEELKHKENSYYWEHVWNTHIKPLLDKHLKENEKNGKISIRNIKKSRH